MKFTKINRLFTVMMFAFVLCSCSGKSETREIYYDAYSYNELVSMIEKLSIDFSQNITKLESIDTDVPRLTSYIQAVKNNRYATTYIMTGLYTDRNGLLYNVYTENEDDYYFEQYVLCNDEEGEIQEEDIIFLLGISGKYYESDAVNGIHETTSRKQLSLFFEEFDYLEAYEVSVGEDFFYCEVWKKDKPYYFYFNNDVLLAAKTYSSTNKEIIYYFTNFSNVADEKRLK